MQQPFGKTLTAGVTWDWDNIQSDCYTSADYDLSYNFRGPGKKIDTTAVASGQGWHVTVPPASTQVTEGTWSWQARLTKKTDATVVIELGRGQVEIVVDLANKADGYDGRSWVKKTLDQLRINLGTLAGRIDQEYTVGGRMLKTMSRTELTKLEGEFTARYRREQIEAGELKPQTNQVLGSFGGPVNPAAAREFFPGGGGS